ncbi:MAG: 2-isopropylmalate synthase, partial [Clostridia bacterium]|nr:2-isopropylmalate synthase [Clostridia bacterium]
RSDVLFLREVFLAAAFAGADVLNIPDTVGISEPEGFGALVRTFASDDAFAGVVFSVHCHNDLGLAVANSLAGVKAGALQVECTATGIGERAGNAALEQIALAALLQSEIYRVKVGLDTRELSALARKVSEHSGLAVPQNAPIIGQNAFSHESGIHQHGMLQNKQTYQILDPALVGREEAKLLLGKLSGRAAFRKKAEELGYRLEKDAMTKAFGAFLQLADRKNLVRDEEVDAILAEVRDEEILSHGFELVAFSIQSNSEGMASADISLKKDGKVLRDAAIGSGPIEAAFHAVERITGARFSLDAYRIRAVTEGKDALGIVLVRLKEGEQIFSGRGVSVDIIEASVKAYVSAVNRAVYYTEEAAKA